jgi:hypothetical protein
VSLNDGRISIFTVSASLDAGFDGRILKPIDFKRLSVILSGNTNTPKRESCLNIPERGGWFSRYLFGPNTSLSRSGSTRKPSEHIVPSCEVPSCRNLDKSEPLDKLEADATPPPETEGILRLWMKRLILEHKRKHTVAGLDLPALRTLRSTATNGADFKQKFTFQFKA